MVQFGHWIDVFDDWFHGGGKLRFVLAVVCNGSLQYLIFMSVIIRQARSSCLRSCKRLSEDVPYDVPA